ncbi:MAG: hypothetical protein ABFD60_07765 [Bryobacteraceae bacterium]
MEKFLGGVTKGMRETPNVFRPLQAESTAGKVGEAATFRAAEAAMLPVTMSWNAVMQGLEDASLITPQTRKNMTDAVIGATPAFMSSKPGSGKQLKEGAKLATEGGKPGHVRIPGTPEPLPPVPEGHIRLYRGETPPSIKSGKKSDIRSIEIDSYFEPPEYKGLWFTESEATARKYTENRDPAYTTKGNLLFVDVPISVAEASRVSKNPEAMRASFSPDAEFVLPRDWASKAMKMPSVSTESLGVEIPNVEPRVNTSRINAEKNVKTTIENVNRLNAERLAEHRKPQTHEQTLAKAKKITVEEALAMPEDTAKLPETGAALRDIATAAGKDLTEVAELAAKGDQAATGKLLDSLAVAGELEARSEMAKRNVARTEEAFKIQAEAERARFDPTSLIDLAQRYSESPNADPAVLAQRLLELRTQERRTSYARQVRTFAKNGVDALYELYVNMLLTPASHAANLVGNTLLASWAPVERAAASLMPGPVTLGEAAGMIRAIPEAFVDGLRGVKEYGWKGEGRSKADITKGPAIASENFGMDGTLPGKVFDILGAGARFNTTLLGAEDAFFKGFNFRMEVKAQAIREAHAQGLKGDAFRAKVADVEAHPEMYPGIYERANEFKLIQTFQDEMGPVGESIQYARSHIPGARIVMPFLRTPNRIVYWAAQRTPGLNLPFIINGQLGSDLMAGGAARQLAAAKIATGAAATSAIAYYAMNGYITGSGPKNPELKRAKRDAGWIPNAIKVGDQYYGYSRLDPFGMMVGMVADSVEFMGQLPEPQAEELGLSLGIAFASNFISKTYMQGLSDFIEAIADPRENAHGYAKGFVRGLVPGAVRAAERSMDPALREARTLLESMQAQVPGWSESLPPTRSLSGQVVNIPEGYGPDWLSPVATSKTTTDPVAKEIERLKMRVSMPLKAIPGKKPPMFQMEEPLSSEGVLLTPQEYDHFVRLAGNELKVNGKGMWDTLGGLIRSAEYQRMSEGPDGGKAEIIHRVIMDYRNAARLQLLEDAPDLRGLVEQKIRMRKERLRPQ